MLCYAGAGCASSRTDLGDPACFARVVFVCGSSTLISLPSSVLFFVAGNPVLALLGRQGWPLCPLAAPMQWWLGFASWRRMISRGVLRGCDSSRIRVVRWRGRASLLALRRTVEGSVLRQMSRSGTRCRTPTQLPVGGRPGGDRTPSRSLLVYKLLDACANSRKTELC